MSLSSSSSSSLCSCSVQCLDANLSVLFPDLSVLRYPLPGDVISVFVQFISLLSHRPSYRLFAFAMFPGGEVSCILRVSAKVHFRLLICSTLFITVVFSYRGVCLLWRYVIFNILLPSVFFVCRQASHFPGQYRNLLSSVAVKSWNEMVSLSYSSMCVFLSARWQSTWISSTCWCRSFS